MRQGVDHDLGDTRRHGHAALQTPYVKACTLLRLRCNAAMGEPRGDGGEEHEEAGQDDAEHVVQGVVGAVEQALCHRDEVLQRRGGVMCCQL